MASLAEQQDGSARPSRHVGELDIRTSANRPTPSAEAVGSSAGRPRHHHSQERGRAPRLRGAFPLRVRIPNGFGRRVERICEEVAPARDNRRDRPYEPVEPARAAGHDRPRPLPRPRTRAGSSGFETSILLGRGRARAGHATRLIGSEHRPADSLSRLPPSSAPTARGSGAADGPPPD